MIANTRLRDGCGSYAKAFMTRVLQDLLVRLWTYVCHSHCLVIKTAQLIHGTLCHYDFFFKIQHPRAVCQIE